MANKLTDLLKSEEPNLPNSFTIAMGKRINQARTELGMSQADLAEKAYLKQSSISRIEAGTRPISAEEILYLSQALKKPAEYFFGDEVGGKEIQEIVMGIRELPSKDRADIYRQVKFLLDLKGIEIEARQYPPNKKIPVELIQNYYNRILPITANANELNDKINKIHDMLDAEMEKNGLKRAGKKK